VKLLLDTHVLIWWWSDKQRVSPLARRLIEDGGNRIFVSAASAWEITTKQRIGKLAGLDHFQPDVPLSFVREMDTDRFESLFVSVEHGLRAGDYVVAHADPFDRILAAQGELEAVPLITRDPAFALFPCETIW
jgi:PIN domain nuclease of toxin-antitoxin system